MAKLRKRKISNRTVDALTVTKDTVFWDSELSGFGVRVYPSGSKFYVVQTRAFGQPAKRVTVGRHGIISPREARRRAALIILRIKSGEEPAPERIGGAVGGGGEPPAGDRRAAGARHRTGTREGSASRTRRNTRDGRPGARPQRGRTAVARFVGEVSRADFRQHRGRHSQGLGRALGLRSYAKGPRPPQQPGARTSPGRAGRDGGHRGIGVPGGTARLVDNGGGRRIGSRRATGGEGNVDPFRHRPTLSILFRIGRVSKT